ncbi:MAG: hypothetical protein ACOYD4_05015 [Solirubrobacterales bacterium]
MGVLFFYAGNEKIIDGHGAPWTILGILESLIFVLVVVSLVRLEFMPERRKSFLLCALALAIFTFSVLAMGQNVTGENSGVAEPFIYAAATAVLMGMVLLMPPYRPANWISGRGGSWGGRNRPRSPRRSPGSGRA